MEEKSLFFLFIYRDLETSNFFLKNAYFHRKFSLGVTIALFHS